MDGGHIVCRVLHRGKGIDLFSQRQHDDTARMLSGGTAHAYTALNNPVDLAVSLAGSPFLIVFLYITESRFIRQCTNGSCTEGLALAEDNLRVVVGLALVLTGEV